MKEGLKKQSLIVVGIFVVMLGLVLHEVECLAAGPEVEMVFVKGGCFQMGDTFGDGQKNEKPVHETCVDDFYTGKYEVTQAQWQAVMGIYGYHFKGSEYPMEGTSWNDVQEFIRKLNSMTGKRFRLPTEAEWEYAARSGGQKEKYSGTSDENALGRFAWYAANSGREVHPVGLKMPNGLGIYDMSGNVSEWVQDWYSENYYEHSPRENPPGPPGGEKQLPRPIYPTESPAHVYRDAGKKVLRGGNWYYGAEFVRSSYRTGIDPELQHGHWGFRLAAPK